MINQQNTWSDISLSSNMTFDQNIEDINSQNPENYSLISKNYIPSILDFNFNLPNSGAEIEDGFISNDEEISSNEAYLQNKSQNNKDSLYYSKFLTIQLEESDYKINNPFYNINDLIDNINKNNNKPAKKKIFYFQKIKKKFNIYSSGIYDSYSKKIIDQVLNDNSNNFHKIINYYNKNSTKRKFIQKRKENSDNIRKKIKARFLKTLKNMINKRLKLAGSKYFFALLPQSFISNTSKEMNKQILDLTLEEILKKDFSEEGKEKLPDVKKCKHNIFVLSYLEKNKEIEENSNFNKIKKMKYSEIFNEYFRSKEFEMEIYILKRQKENDKYIKNYIAIAKNFLYYYSQ